MNLLLAAFFVVWLAISVLRLPPLHPVQIWSASLGLGVVAYSLHLLPYRPLGTFTVALLVGGTITFTAATLLGTRLAGRGTTALSSQIDYRLVRRTAYVCLALTAAMLLAFIAQTAREYGLQSALLIDHRVRNEIAAGNYAVTVKYIYPAFAATAICALAFAAAPDRRARLRWGVLTVASISTLWFSTGRGNLITAVAIATVAIVVSRGVRIRPRQLLAGGVTLLVLAFAVFYVGGQVIGKTFEVSDMSTVRSPFTEHRSLRPLAWAYQYTAAPIAALDVQVEVSGTWGRADGCATLSLACRALRLVGAPVTPEPVLQRAFTAKPLPWNTFTAFDLPLMDGGRALVIPIVGLLGLMMGALWACALRRTALGVALYALFSPAVVWTGTLNHYFAPHIVGAAIIAVTSLLLVQRRLKGGTVHEIA